MRGSSRTELHIAPGGIDSLRSQLLGPSTGLAPLRPTQALFKNAPGVFVRAACSLRSQSVQLAVASCRTPVGDSHPPFSENIKEKSPYFRTSSHLEYGGEGGIDSLRSQLLGPSMGLAPLGPTQALFKNAPGVFVRAACSLRSQSVQLAVASCRTPVGGSHPPLFGEYKRKKPVLSYELSSRIWR